MNTEEIGLGKWESLVLECVDVIPEGMVATYGDIARIVGTGPRHVGRIMSTHGHLTCWWRVVRADGHSQVARRAVKHWDEEGIAYHLGDNIRVDMKMHRISEKQSSLISHTLAGQNEYVCEAKLL